jgi:MYXO-CTERM domain-containing protein
MLIASSLTVLEMRCAYSVEPTNPSVVVSKTATTSQGEIPRRSVGGTRGINLSDNAAIAARQSGREQNAAFTQQLCLGAARSSLSVTTRSPIRTSDAIMADPMTVKASSIIMVCASLLVARAAAAASVTIQAGQTYTLSGDLTLNGADTLDANGTVSSPCTIVGNGHGIIGNALTGHVKIQNCILTGLGGTQETQPAVELTGQGNADLTIIGSTFDASGTIRLHANGSTTVTFNNNLLKDNGIAYIQDELVGSMYVPAFYTDGGSTATKVFQGNRIYRDAARFEGVNNWLIGGYGDQYMNVVIGHRGTINVGGDHMKIVGNFLHPQYPIMSPDVDNLAVGSTADNPDLLIEHNVVRSGEWVLHECKGEVRYNVIADMNGHAWIKGPHTCDVHHNIFVNYNNLDHNSEGGIDIVYLVSNLNIYNNTFDGGGMIGNLGVPAIHAKMGRIIERVHSNAFTNFLISNKMYAIIGNLGPDTYDDNPPPGDARIHYADYNLFYNPDSPGIPDYTLKVEPDDMTPIPIGSAEGAGMHDVHAVPGFKGPLPTAFPFDDTAVENGTVTMSMMLAHYRDLYTPAAGSPLVGAGSPMGGANNNIGAVGQGATLDPSDMIGTFQPGTGGGPPLLTGTGGSTGGTGTGGTTGAGGTAGKGGSAGTGGTTGTGNPGAGGSAGAGNPQGTATGGGTVTAGCGCAMGRTSGGWAALGGLALVALGLRRASRRRRR